MCDFIAIMPAAGIGRRMKHNLPKQYFNIGNKTLIEYSINSLICHSFIKQIIVVIHRNDHWFHKLSVASNPRIVTVIGGKTRTDSVMAALKHITNFDKGNWVIIHDAVRPFLHKNDLLRLLKTITYTQIGSILAIPVSDTVKRSYVDSNLIQYTVERKNLWHALTPQLFNYKLLKDAVSKVLDNGCIVSDESSAMEFCGYHPWLVPGRSDNIKVTYPEDLEIAGVYLSKFYNSNSSRNKKNNANWSWF